MATEPAFSTSREPMILRGILVQEQEHEIDLSAAPGSDVPPAIKPANIKAVKTK